LPILSQSQISEFIPRLYDNDGQKDRIVSFIRDSKKDEFDEFVVQFSQLHKEIRDRRGRENRPRRISFSAKDVFG